MWLELAGFGRGVQGMSGTGHMEVHTRRLAHWEIIFRTRGFSSESPTCARGAGWSGSATVDLGDHSSTGVRAGQRRILTLWTGRAARSVAVNYMAENGVIKVKNLPSFDF